MVLYVLIFFVYDITWCLYYGHYELYFGGGSYSFLYIPPPICVFHIPCNVYPCFISCGIQNRNMFYIVYAYFFVDITPSFSFYHLCETYP